MAAESVPFLQMPTSSFTTMAARKFIAREGWDGYGLFWGVACAVNAEEGARLAWACPEDAQALASVLGVAPSWLDSVMATACELGMLECDGGWVTCPLATRSHEAVRKASDHARKAAAKRWDTRR